ncbi:MAG: hypothetical protein ACRDFB_06265 [Rhabdochlamydiaceae bacterium]
MAIDVKTYVLQKIPANLLTLDSLYFTGVTSDGKGLVFYGIDSAIEKFVYGAYFLDFTAATFHKQPIGKFTDVIFYNYPGSTYPFFGTHQLNTGLFPVTKNGSNFLTLSSFVIPSPSAPVSAGGVYFGNDPAYVTTYDKTGIIIRNMYNNAPAYPQGNYGAFGYRGPLYFYPDGPFPISSDGRNLFCVSNPGSSITVNQTVYRGILSKYANTLFKDGNGYQFSGYQFEKADDVLEIPEADFIINPTDSYFNQFTYNMLNGINFVYAGGRDGITDAIVPEDVGIDLSNYIRTVYDKTKSIESVWNTGTYGTSSFKMTKNYDGTFSGAYLPVSYANPTPWYPNTGAPPQYFSPTGFFARYNYRGLATQYFVPSLPVGPAGTTLGEPILNWAHPDGYFLSLHEDTQHPGDYYIAIAGYGFYNAQSCANWARGVPLTGASPVNTNDIGYLKA